MRSPLATYGWTLVAVAAAGLARWLLDPWLEDSQPYLTFLVAVAIAAGLGGLRPALLATGLGLLLAWFSFVPTRFSFELQGTPHVLGLALYALVSLTLSGFGEVLLRTRRTAEARRESLRTTLASIGDAVITTDVEGRVTSVNPVAETLTGWTQQDAAGRPLEDVFRIVNEESRTPVPNPAQKVLSEGRTLGLANHTVLIARDGTELPIDDSAAPIRDREGEVLGVVLVFREIAERRKAERLIAAARAYAESIVSTVQVPLLVLDADLRVKTANQSFCRTFHVTPQETENRLIYDLGNRQWDIPRLRSLLEDVLPQNTTLEGYEVEHDFPAIGRRILLLNARRLLREGNHTELILLSLEDITERRQAQEVERRLASVIESSNDAIVTKSLDGIIRSWNAAAEELLGYTAEQAVGRHITFIIPADRADEEERIIARLRAGERVEHFDTVRMRSDGQPVHVSLTISPIKDSTGRVIGASKIARDITEKKRLEDELRKVAADLSEADHRKNEFLALLAHELRNPLVPIRNSLRILRMMGGDRNTIQSASEVMERQIDQMVRLIDDLLDVSRISRGKMELRSERVGLASVVSYAVEAVRPLIEGRNHELLITLPAQPIYLNADPTRLAQVVGNLLNNSCKFTNPGGRIQLTVAREADQALIRVEDNGMGIGEDQFSRIFELFTQVDTSLERPHAGLGIGLTLVKNLVEMHEGRVEVHSAGEDRGCEFVVRLPITVATSKPPDAITSEPTPTTALRILVVDDNLDSATTLALLLRLSGNETRTANDGLEAVEVAGEFQPDVVLLDIGLPKLNGYEACRRIREQSWAKNVVLVAVTGWGQDEDRKRSREAGFDGHLVKPVDHAALMKLLVSLSEPGH